MPLRGRVGRHANSGVQCQNWLEDQQTVIALLNLIPAADGGAEASLAGRVVAGIASYKNNIFLANKQGSSIPAGRFSRAWKCSPCGRAQPPSPPPDNGVNSRADRFRGLFAKP
jgi:hypothetical protein